MDITEVFQIAIVFLLLDGVNKISQFCPSLKFIL